MKKTSLVLLTFFAAIEVAACPLCNKEINNAIYNSTFYPNLFIILSPFIVLALIVAALVVITNKRHNNWVTANPNVKVLSPVPLTTASVIIGIGFGGFVDGILLHQILQVHEMLSNKIAATNYTGKSVNMFWDGIFHAFCFFSAVTGVVQLWKLMLRNDVDRSGNLFVAGLMFGWGTFNLVEGLMDHQILKLHNVIEFAQDHATGNYIFLSTSVVMSVIGWLLVRRAHRKSYRS